MKIQNNLSKLSKITGLKIFLKISYFDCSDAIRMKIVNFRKLPLEIFTIISFNDSLINGLTQVSRIAFSGFLYSLLTNDTSKKQFKSQCFSQKRPSGCFFHKYIH